MELRAHNFDDDDEEIDSLLYERSKFMESDGRPGISKSIDKHSMELIKKEEEVVIKRIKKNEEEKENERKTIMDMRLADIIQKTSETTANFMNDYNIKLIESKYHYEKKYDLDSEKTTWSDFFTIHSLAFVEYMKHGDNTLYIGILFVIISVIIYLFI